MPDVLPTPDPLPGPDPFPPFPPLPEPPTLHLPLPPLPLPGWWDDIFVSLGCRTRILMVSDGGAGFGPSGFGLQEAVSIVKTATTTDHPIEVVTASTGGAPGADVTAFEFDKNHVVNGQTRRLGDYDELWLFGFDSSNSGMTGPPLNAIVTFMAGGGGVFATGDHDNLGGALCGEIPRVRSMRRWYTTGTTAPGGAPPGGGTGRRDTNVPSPGADPQFDLQSDNVPQRIYPAWYGPADAAIPHPLLSFSDGAVTYLPDHPHEGECVVPMSLDPVEWPADAGGTHIPPEVVAWGVSAGPGFRSDKPSVSPPTLFGVIGAYDGHRTGTGIGRIVVDSTWHHWININLNGSGATPLSGGVPTNGLYRSGAPTAEYEQIKAYFRNIAGWLEPNRLRLCWIRLRIPILRWEWPIVQELDPRRFDDLEHLVEIGRLVRTMIRRHHGPSAVGLVAGALVRDEQRPLVDELADGKRPSLPLGFDPELLRDAALGGAMVAFADATPDGVDAPDAMRRLLGPEPNDEQLLDLLTAGATKGLELLSEELAAAGRRLTATRKMLTA